AATCTMSPALAAAIAALIVASGAAALPLPPPAAPARTHQTATPACAPVQAWIWPLSPVTANRSDISGVAASANVASDGADSMLATTAIHFARPSITGLPFVVAAAVAAASGTMRCHAGSGSQGPGPHWWLSCTRRQR